MKLYLSAIRSYHLDLDINITAFSDLRLELALQDIKQEHKEPDRRNRKQLTRLQLILLRRALDMESYRDIAIRAAFTLAFTGFLRVREFTYRQADLELGPAFRKWFSTKNSIQLHEGGNYMKLTLPASKTDPFSGGIQLTIAASSDEG